MAAITSAAIATAGLGLAAYQTAKANQDKKNAKRALNNFERHDLSNAFEDIPISTIGSDYMREENQLATAGAIDAAQNGGARVITGTLPRIVAANNDANRAGQAYLDNQVQQRNYAIANDNVRIQGVNEQRDNMDLSGIGTAIQTARQDEWSGIRGMYNSLGYMSNTIPGALKKANTADTGAADAGNSTYPGAPYPSETPYPYFNFMNPNQGF